jgi:ABC-2 type transport system permease protein
VAVTVDEDTAGRARPVIADAPGSRSWTRAFGDLRQGWHQRALWGHLGWQDIKQRYRRSVLGPLWISISMGVIALGLGILYSLLFQTDITTFLPHVAVGLLIWNFISGCILEGSEVFIANEGLIKFLPAPLSLHVYRLVWRQTLFFLHNLVIWAVLMIVFPHPLSWTLVLAVGSPSCPASSPPGSGTSRRSSRASSSWPST